MYTQLNTDGRFMRDSSESERTGWIQEGEWQNVGRGDPNFVPGSPFHGRNLEGLGSFEKRAAAGAKYIEAALQDPEARVHVEQCLVAADPEACVSAQIEQDLAEYVNPTGKIIVFKSLVEELGPKLRAVEDRLVQALPSQDTEEGHDALDIMNSAGDPQSSLELYFTQLAMEEIIPGVEDFGLSGLVAGIYDSEEEALEDLEMYGLGMTKKGKKWLKTGAIVVGAAALAVGAIVAAPVIIPALASAVSAVGGAVASGATAVVGAAASAFATQKMKGGNGGGSPAYSAEQQVADLMAQGYSEEEARAIVGGQQPRPEKGATIDFSGVAEAALQIYALRKSDPSRAAQAEGQLLRYLVSQGLSEGEAADMVAQAYERAAQMYAERVEEEVIDRRPMPPTPTPTPTYGMPGAPVEFPGVPEEEPPKAAKAGIGTGGAIALALAAVALAGGAGKGRGRRR